MILILIFKSSITFRIKSSTDTLTVWTFEPSKHWRVATLKKSQPPPCQHLALINNTSRSLHTKPNSLHMLMRLPYQTNDQYSFMFSFCMYFLTTASIRNSKYIQYHVTGFRCLLVADCRRVGKWKHHFKEFAGDFSFASFFFSRYLAFDTSAWFCVEASLVSSDCKKCVRWDINDSVEIKYLSFYERSTGNNFQFEAGVIAHVLVIPIW